MDDSERRIEKVAMYAANAGPIDDRDFYAEMREKVPGVTREEIDRGLVRGSNRAKNRLLAKFGRPPEPGIPEGPLDHGDDESA